VLVLAVNMSDGLLLTSNHNPEHSVYTTQRVCPSTIGRTPKNTRKTVFLEAGSQKKIEEIPNANGIPISAFVIISSCCCHSSHHISVAFTDVELYSYYTCLAYHMNTALHVINMHSTMKGSIVFDRMEVVPKQQQHTLGVVIDGCH
jgi:hypothetical protein